MNRAGKSLICIAITISLAAVSFAGERVIPSERCRGLWFVPISYGDDPAQTLNMILDTGAQSTSVDPDAVERVFGRKIRVGCRRPTDDPGREKVRLTVLRNGVVMEFDVGIAVLVP